MALKMLVDNLWKTMPHLVGYRRYWLSFQHQKGYTTVFVLCGIMLTFYDPDARPEGIT